MLERNVVFITLDCCRYDTFHTARVPFLRRLGALACAETYATFTLPAHCAYFTGYLPRAVGTKRWDYYSRGARTLWRLASARPKPADEVALLLSGTTIVEGYRRLGYFTLGVGGVRWFRSAMLQAPFDEFLYWGNDEDVFCARRASDFPLHHGDEIVARLRRHPRWFLFLNAPETHVPYDVGSGLPETVDAALKRAAPLWGGKRHNLEHSLATADDFRCLHRAQVGALEHVDAQLQQLIEALPGPKLVVVCGDHGEAFGEGGMYGHGFPHERVVNVPLVIGFLD